MQQLCKPAGWLHVVLGRKLASAELPQECLGKPGAPLNLNPGKPYTGAGSGIQCSGLVLLKLDCGAYEIAAVEFGQV